MYLGYEKSDVYETGEDTLNLRQVEKGTDDRFPLL